MCELFSMHSPRHFLGKIARGTQCFINSAVSPHWACHCISYVAANKYALLNMLQFTKFQRDAAKKQKSAFNLNFSPGVDRFSDTATQKARGKGKCKSNQCTNQGRKKLFFKQIRTMLDMDRSQFHLWNCRDEGGTRGKSFSSNFGFVAERSVCRRSEQGRKDCSGGGQVLKSLLWPSISSYKECMFSPASLAYPLPIRGQALD